MEIRKLDIGLERVSRWRSQDDLHLPEGRGKAFSFIPQQRLLDSILKRPSLDERLPQLLQPAFVDPSILETSTWESLRVEVCSLFASLAMGEKESRREGVGKNEKLRKAVDVLQHDDALNEEVRMSLAALLKG